MVTDEIEAARALLAPTHPELIERYDRALERNGDTGAGYAERYELDDARETLLQCARSALAKPPIVAPMTPEQLAAEKLQPGEEHLLDRFRRVPR